MVLPNWLTEKMDIKSLNTLSTALLNKSFQMQSNILSLYLTAQNPHQIKLSLTQLAIAMPQKYWNINQQLGNSVAK